MIRYCILIIASTLIVACEKREPVEPLEKTGYPQSYTKISNPASTPLEKPSLEDEYYDVPKM